VQINTLLYRNSVLLFTVFVAVIVWGFWPSYYAHPWQALPATRYHVHGAVMTAWLLLLLAQAYLIRSNRRAVHRRVGKASYVLAPLIVATFVIMIHGSGAVQRHAASDQIRLQTLLFDLLGAVVLFALFYLLAMLNRHTPATHARYMICTLFPIYSPSTDRLIGRGFPGNQLAAECAWFAGDLILLSLAIWDWRSNRRFGPFAVAFTTMVLYHSAYFVAPSIPGWAAFANWFAHY
jgi:hypothetical protein